jgi:hypothetical protein
MAEFAKVETLTQASPRPKRKRDSANDLLPRLSSSKDCTYELRLSASLLSALAVKDPDLALSEALLTALAGTKTTSSSWWGSASKLFKQVLTDLLADLLMTTPTINDQPLVRVFPPVALGAIVVLNDDSQFFALIATLVLATNGCTHLNFSHSDVAELFVGDWVCPVIYDDMSFAAVQFRVESRDAKSCLTRLRAVCVDVSLDAETRLKPFVDSILFFLQHIGIANHCKDASSLVAFANPVQAKIAARKIEDSECVRTAALRQAFRVCFKMCSFARDHLTDTGWTVDSLKSSMKASPATSLDALVAVVTSSLDIEGRLHAPGRDRPSKPGHKSSMQMANDLLRSPTQERAVRQKVTGMSPGPTGELSEFAKMIAHTTNQSSTFRMMHGGWADDVNAMFVVYSVALIDEHTACISVGFMSTETVHENLFPNKAPVHQFITEVCVRGMGSYRVAVKDLDIVSPVLQVPHVLLNGNVLGVSFYTCYVQRKLIEMNSTILVSKFLREQVQNLRNSSVYGVTIGVVLKNAAPRDTTSMKQIVLPLRAFHEKDMPAFVDSVRLLRVMRLEKQFELVSRVLNVAVCVYTWDVAVNEHRELREYNANGSRWALYAKQTETGRWCFHRHTCGHHSRDRSFFISDGFNPKPGVHVANQWTTAVLLKNEDNDGDISTRTFLWAVGFVLKEWTTICAVSGLVVERATMGPSFETHRYADWATTPASLFIDLANRTSTNYPLQREYVCTTEQRRIWSSNSMFSEWPFKHANMLVNQAFDRQTNDVMLRVYYGQAGNKYRGVVGWATVSQGIAPVASVFSTQSATHSCCFNITFGNAFQKQSLVDAYVSIRFDQEKLLRYVTVAFATHILPTHASQFSFRQRALHSTSVTSCTAGWFDMEDHECVSSEALHTSEFHPLGSHRSVDLLGAMMYTSEKTNTDTPSPDEHIPPGLGCITFAVPEANGAPRAHRITLRHTAVNPPGRVIEFNATVFDPVAICFM